MMLPCLTLLEDSMYLDYMEGSFIDLRNFENRGFIFVGEWFFIYSFQFKKLIYRERKV